ncbi:hypothetical protein [Geitlerinema sp. P-1104]|uniref:hypothetical protein n=1 Tax=Geitlerinema sp. P-1104 TaxID=2546230 RepID=UPI0019816F36|nr:hypothetical protein [Geitlerinema sp. P-1104]
MKSAPECPRCGKHSIVQQSDSRWTCLNCGFSKSLSHHRNHDHDSDEEDQNGGWFGIVILAGILLVVMVQVVDGQELPQQYREASTPTVTLEQSNQP